MKRTSFRWSVPVLLAVMAGACAEGVSGDGDEGEAPGSESDSATLRQKAMNEWYNETSVAPDPTGPWSHEYRKFILEAASRERDRWGKLLPSPDARFTPFAVSGTTWSNLGPTQAHVLTNGLTTLNVTDSGRVRSIVVDGTRIFVATAGGGVWRSADSGGSWTPVTESLGSLSTGSLAMDPVNHDTLYLGLGDPFDGTGIGLVKSTDAGNTWSAPVYLGDSTIIPQVMVHPTAPAIILAATNKGLYRSTDSGATFQVAAIDPGDKDATTQAPIPAYVWSIAWTGGHGFVASLEGNHAATTGTTDGQIWTSADDGATWTRATGFTPTGNVGRITVAAAPSNRQQLYAMAAVPLATTSTDLADMYKSQNGGTTWTALNVAAKSYSNTNTESSKVGTLLNGQGWYDQLILINPTNPNLVYFGGALLLAKTADGGNTFSQVSNWLAQFSLPYVHADFHAGTFDDSGNLYVGTDGGVFLSSDAGAHFTDALNIGIVTHLLYSVGSSPQNRSAVLGGMQDNGTRVREGTSSVFNEYIGGDGFGSVMNLTNANQMLGSLYYDRILKSTNGGTSFTSASTGITESNNSSTAPFITRILPWEGTTTGNEVYTFSNTKVYRSTNFAGSWSAIGTVPVPTGGIIRNIGVAASNASNIGVVGSGGYVWKSTNGGTSFTVLASGQSPDSTTALPNSKKSLSCIYFDRTNPSILYVASVAPDATASHLWKSTDGGTSFAAIDGNGFPTGVPVNMIKADPQSATTLYAGTHMGVYRSTDGGTSWSRFGAGMPLVSVTDIYISPDTSLVRAASYGRGFWELGGAAQSDFSIGANPATVSALQGQSGTTTITTAVTSGAAQTIALAVSGLPAGATANVAPMSVTAGSSAQLTLTAGAATPVGPHAVTVTGTAGGTSHSTTVTFTVTAPVTNDFSLAVSPAAVSAVQGQSATATVTTAVVSGSPESVALTATGAPAGVSATIAPTSVTAGGTATLTLSADGTVQPGSYTVHVTGTSASASHAQDITFSVTAPASDFGLAASPASVSVAQGGAAASQISATITAGSAQAVALSAAGLPAGVSASFAPTSVTSGDGPATLTLSVSASAAPGSYTVIVTGVGASGTHTTSLGLTVTPTTTTGGPIVNGDFETGDLSGWTPVGTTSVGPGHAGSFSGVAGANNVATNGDSSLAQTFTVPAAGGSLAFWYNVHCPDKLTYDWATATLTDNTAGTTQTILAKTCPTTSTWTRVTAALPAGHSVTLTLINHDDNYAGDATWTQFDDVTITAPTPPTGGSIVNGGFEDGTLSPWVKTGTAAITTKYLHGGAGAARTGSTQPTAGDSTLAQTFTVPDGATTLSFWYLMVCPDTLTYDWATATLRDNTAGTTSTILPKVCTSNPAWTQVTAPVIAGHSVTLTLTSHDDDWAGDATATYYDDVTVQ
jgi:hypothetical protein